MRSKVTSFLTSLIDFQFHLLFILTPLIFIPHNYEIFEFNKIILVYILTTTILVSTISKMILLNRFQIPRTPFDIPIILILISRTISTAMSIDRHTSLWGYYSRFNEGLIATFAYIILFYCFVEHFSKKTRLHNLIFLLFSGALLVAIWGLPGYFGFDLSCIFINGQLTYTCWQSDSNPMNRIYSTLGQPNWFGAYLSMALPLGVAYILLKKPSKAWAWVLVMAVMYLSFTLSFSRGASLGLLASVITFLALIILSKYKKPLDLNLKQATKPLLVLLGLCLAINLFFGSAFTKRPVMLKKLSSTQLENGGTESGQIRLIVWKGAIEIFKKYPIFGSGLETFAYAYTASRPMEHNLTSEWEFIYNKAHNEYLNSLSTTGIFGLSALLLFLAAFFRQSIKLIRSSSNKENILLIIGLVSGYSAFLTQNVLGFSVVVLSLLSFLIPAIIASQNRLDNGDHKNFGFSLPAVKWSSPILLFVMILTLVGSLNFTLNYWLADYYFNQANSLVDRDNVDKAISYYHKAISLKNEPIYHSQLGIAYSIKATSKEPVSDTSSAASLAISESYLSLTTSPYNISYYKSLYWALNNLGTLDKRFYSESYDLMKTALILAPTDPKIYYNLAVSFAKIRQDNTKDKETAIKLFEKAIQVKTNWIEPRKSLAEFYISTGEKDKAASEYQQILDLAPEALDIKEALEKLQPTT